MRILGDPRGAVRGDVLRLSSGYWRVKCTHMGTVGAVPLPWWQVPWAVVCDFWRSLDMRGT